MDVTLRDPAHSAPFGLVPMQQHPHYAACLRHLGTEAMAADFHDDGRHVARAQVYARRIGPARVFWMPRGPVWRDPPDDRAPTLALRDLRRTVARRGLWIVSQDGTGPLPATLPLSRAQRVAEMDLARDTATRRAALHPKWRRALVRAEAAGLRIEARTLRPADAALLAHEAAQRRDRRYAALPAAFTTAWAALHPDATRILVAHSGGAPVAFMLFLLHAPVATYHIGWSGPEGRRLAAHALLLWRASDWLAAQGFLRLDLGALDPRTPGLDRFKLRSGALPRTLGPARLLLPI